MTSVKNAITFVTAPCNTVKPENYQRIPLVLINSLPLNASWQASASTYDDDYLMPINATQSAGSFHGTTTRNMTPRKRQTKRTAAATVTD